MRGHTSFVIGPQFARVADRALPPLSKFEEFAGGRAAGLPRTHQSRAWSGRMYRRVVALVRAGASHSELKEATGISGQACMDAYHRLPPELR